MKNKTNQTHTHTHIYMDTKPLTIREELWQINPQICNIPGLRGIMFLEYIEMLSGKVSNKVMKNLWSFKTCNDKCTL